MILRVVPEGLISALPDRGIAVVLGTRPEIVKLAEILRILGPKARLVHTGQHFDAAMSDVFLDSLGLPWPDLHLAVGGTRRAAQIGTALAELDRYFAEDRPTAVVVQGDTNATAAGALVANANDIPLVHVEAGLRSHDRGMPEEHNRIVTDHLADLLCAPSSVAVGNLAKEGIDLDRVVLTGNTVVEAVHSQLPAPAERSALLERHGLCADSYVLATIHRPENTDNAQSLRQNLAALRGLPVPVVLPLHPRTAAAIVRHGLDVGAPDSWR
jgi:UDP-N-acetylglucosamine 2-epimerase (non-hydrolysing)